MPRKIRVTVEVFDPTDTTEFADLPAGWDEMSQREQDKYLNALALDYLANQAGSGAEVVDVDENGREA